MPLYALSCEARHEVDGRSAEGFTEEVVLPRFDSPNPPCSLCGGPTERTWQGAKHFGAASPFPLLTKMFDGKPRIVESSREMARLCKERGWRVRDDETFIDEDYLGAEWVPGKGSDVNDRIRGGKWIQRYASPSVQGTWQFDWSNHHPSE